MGGDRGFRESRLGILIVFLLCCCGTLGCNVMIIFYIIVRCAINNVVRVHRMVNDFREVVAECGNVLLWCIYTL